MCVLGGWDKYVHVCVCVCTSANVCIGGWGGISTCVCVCMSANQSVQLVHVPLSSWHNAVLGTQLDKVCYYSRTHSSAPCSQSSHVSPALDRLPVLPLQVWLTGLD